MARGDIVMCFPSDAMKGCWKETGVISLKCNFKTNEVIYKIN